MAPRRAWFKVARYAGGFLLSLALLWCLLGLLPAPYARPAQSVFLLLAAGAALALLHAMLPGLPLFTPAIRRLPKRCRESGQVALTFDDGPVEPYTGQVLDILKQGGVRATFFVIGENVRACPGLVRRMIAEGHTVGNHTGSHEILLGRHPGEVLAEIEAGARAIEEVAGVRPRFLRFPKGYRPLGLTRRLARQGWQLAFWTFPIYDVQNPPPEELVRRVLSQVKAGDIVLMHDGFSSRTRSVRDRSSLVAALPEMLRGLQTKGLVPVALQRAFAD